MQHSEFPSDETLAAFIDGRTDAETRKRVIEHMTDCPDCYSIFLGATEMRGTTVEKVVPFRRRRIAAISLAAAAAAATIALLVAPIRDRLLPRSKIGLAALAEAAPPQRNIEGRLSGFPYRPLAPVTRGPADTNPARNPDNWRLLGAAARVQEEARKNRSAENLHALGVSHLLLGNWDEAVNTLEDALKKETGEQDIPKAIQKSHDAALLNDLSAAYYARSQWRNRPRDLVACAEAAEDAWKLRQDPEIAWNRAMALQSLHLTSAARAAWNDYFRLEKSENWTSEARNWAKRSSARPLSDIWDTERQNILKAASAHNPSRIARIVRHFPQQSRVWVEDDLLPQWVDRLARGDRGSAEMYSYAVREIAGTLANTHGDDLLLRAVSVIDAESHPGSSSLHLLANGHAKYHEARAAYRTQNSGAARAEFSRSAKSLRAADSPFAVLPNIFEAASLYYENDYRGSLRVIHFLEDILAPSFHAAKAMTAWVRGLDEADSGHPYEAAISFNRAVDEFTTGGETENAVAVHSLLAELYESVGDEEASWLHRGRVIELAGEVADINRVSVCLESLVDSTLRDRFPAVAGRIADVLIENGQRIHSPVLLFNAFLRRARASALDGNTNAAQTHLRAARESARTIKLAETRAKMEMFLDEAEAELGVERLSALDRAIVFAGSRGNHFVLARLLLKRGRLRLLIGNLSDANVDFASGISEIERQSGSGNADERQSSYAVARDLFDGEVDALLRQQKASQAFSVAERMRWQMIGEFIGRSHTSEPRFRPDIELVSRRLQPRALLLAYWTLPDRLVCWAVSDDGFEVHQTPIDRDRLRRDVFKLQSLIASEQADDASLQLRQQLSDLLIGPIAHLLAGTERLAIIPDEDLWSLPFPALSVKGVGYLVQQSEIRLIPSAALLNLPSAAQRKPPYALVAFGNPNFDHRLLPRAPPLSEAESEVRAAAESLSGTRIFLRGDATASAFRAMAPLGRYIHLACHALRGNRGAGSALMLATDDLTRDEGLLYSNEIARLRLQACECVFLSGCATAAAPSNRSMLTLATAFLTAGADSVVGTLWDIQDESASRIVGLFYRQVQNGDDPAGALRAVQRGVIATKKSALRDWAAFTVLASSFGAENVNEVNLERRGPHGICDRRDHRYRAPVTAVRSETARLDRGD